jgi:hypothetical protein
LGTKKSKKKIYNFTIWHHNCTIPDPNKTIESSQRENLKKLIPLIYTFPREKSIGFKSDVKKAAIPSLNFKSPFISWLDGKEEKVFSPTNEQFFSLLRSLSRINFKLETTSVEFVMHCFEA